MSHAISWETRLSWMYQSGLRCSVNPCILANSLLTFILCWLCHFPLYKLSLCILSNAYSHIPIVSTEVYSVNNHSNCLVGVIWLIKRYIHRAHVVALQYAHACKSVTWLLELEFVHTHQSDLSIWHVTAKHLSEISNILLETSIFTPCSELTTDVNMLTVVANC